VTTIPEHDRPVDYDYHREVAARMRAEAMHELVSKGLSAIRPSRGAVRTAGLALALGSGAFWLVMLTSPPQTEAADAGSATAVPASPAPMAILPDHPL